MPTNTADQQLTMPILADAANNQTAFSTYTTGVESRLAKRYVDLADRAARNPAPTAGEISYLTSNGVHYRWTGSAWWELYPLMAYKANQTQVVNNSTAFVDDSHLIINMQANAVYIADGVVIAESGTTGKLKFTYSGPVGATANRTGFFGIAAATTTTTGAIDTGSGTTLTTSHSRGAAGIGQSTTFILTADVITVGTAGPLTFRWAQSALEAVNTRVNTGSWLRLTRVG